MRVSDLVGARVCDEQGNDLGGVNDVRLVQDGPILGTWGAAFRISGLIVSRRRIGSFLGYEHDTMRGPWLVRTVVRWLHRDALFVPWSAVREMGDRVVHVAVQDSVPLTTKSKG